MNDEGLADVEAASPFRLPRLHPGIGSRPISFMDTTPYRLPSGSHTLYRPVGMRMGLEFLADSEEPGLRSDD